jgi:heme-degrading monooxygenase HmoA
MYTSTFTFAEREFDDEFTAPDNAIARVASSTPGYLGEESWENPSNGLVSNVYYWETIESLQSVMRHPAHIAAQQRQQQWLAGYHVVIAQVVGNYGDGGIGHSLAGMNLPAPGRAEPNR